MMNELNWRRVLATGGILGLLAGLVPIVMHNPSYLYSTLPIATMFAVYFLVPRLDSRRFVSALICSVLTSVLALVIFFIYDFAVFGSVIGMANLKTAMSQLLLTTLFICVVGSFAFTKVHEWTEKKRLDMEAKRAAERQEQAKSKETKHYKIRSKRKYKKKK